MKIGHEEGEVCGRQNCTGVIEAAKPENCSCHISPPCSSCTENKNFCSKCGWEAKYDRRFNEFVVNQKPNQIKWTTWHRRELDVSNKKIDYYSEADTYCSMIKEGIYREGISQEEVLKEVKGTFGGRFEYFGGGKFKYIAYTD